MTCKPNNTPPSKVAASCHRRCPHRRRQRLAVRFAATTTVANDEQQQQQQQQQQTTTGETLWWQREEMVNIRDSVKALANDIREKEEENPKVACYSKTFLKLHRECFQRADKLLFQEKKKSKDSSNTTLSNSLQQSLAHWTASHPNRRGLEKVVLPQIGLDRFQRRQQLVRMVLSLQKHCHMDPLKANAGEQTRLIRMVSESLSLGARRYAVAMGAADATAADLCK